MEFAATAREAPADAAWPDLKMNFSASGGKLQSATFKGLESALFSEVSSQWYDGITEPEHTSSISQLARFVNTHVCNRYNTVCKPPDGGTPPTVPDIRRLFHPQLSQVTLPNQKLIACRSSLRLA